MAKWHVYVDSWGNSRAFYDAITNNVRITAYLADNDGDAVDWSVFENGKLIAEGEVWPEDGPLNGQHSSDEDWAWATAQRNAEFYITKMLEEDDE